MKNTLPVYSSAFFGGPEAVELFNEVNTITVTSKTCIDDLPRFSSIRLKVLDADKKSMIHKSNGPSFVKEVFLIDNLIMKVVCCQDQSSDVFQRACREVECYAALINRHEINAVQMLDYDIDKDKNRVVILFDRLDSTLSRYVYDGGFTRKNAVELGIFLCHTIDQLLELGIVYSDISPENIYVNIDNKTNITFVLGDFDGIVSLDDQGSKCYMGTFPFVSPERIFSEKAQSYGIVKLIVWCLMGGTLHSFDTNNYGEKNNSSDIKTIDVQNEEPSPSVIQESSQLEEDYEVLHDPVLVPLKTALLHDPQKRPDLEDLHSILESIKIQLDKEAVYN